MTQVPKIDSNATGLAYTEEATLGVTGANPWYSLKPNSYADFGGELTTVAPNPICPDRSNQFGVGVDVDAAGGFNHNFDFFSIQELLQGICFASTRKKGEEAATSIFLAGGSEDLVNMASTTGYLVGSLVLNTNFDAAGNNKFYEVLTIVADTSIATTEGTLIADAAPAATSNTQVIGFAGEPGDIDVDDTGSLPAFTSTLIDFTTLGLIVGEWIFVGGDVAGTGFGTAANNGFKRISKIEANRLEFDKSVLTMVTEASTTETIHLYFGNVTRNEPQNAIVRRSYTVERLLGAPDDASPLAYQSEHIKGAVPSSMSLEIPIANLMNFDMTFLALDHITRTAAETPLQSSVVSLGYADTMNTTSDFSRIKMAIVTEGNAAPDPLSGFVTAITLAIDNNLSPNKAIGTMGAFDISAGNFSVSGSVSAYFSNVAAVAAVRANSKVTLDAIIVKENQGVVIDIPLISLGDGRLSVEKDQPIMLPLNMDAATAKSINPDLTHTILFNHFHYLPESAE